MGAAYYRRWLVGCDLNAGWFRGGCALIECTGDKLVQKYSILSEEPVLPGKGVQSGPELGLTFILNSFANANFKSRTPSYDPEVAVNHRHDGLPQLIFAHLGSNPAGAHAHPRSPGLTV